MLIPCKVSDGLRPQEATVEVTNFHGQKEYLPVDRAFILYRESKPYLPVHVVHLDKEHGAALIDLPVEADSGANRIWVPLAEALDTRATA